MAKQKRKLDVPIRDARPAPPGAGQAEDVIEVEVVENGPGVSKRVLAGVARGARAAGDTARSARVNGVRDTFIAQPIDAVREARGSASPRLQGRKEGRSRREQEARVRAAQASDTKQSLKERVALENEAKLDPLAKLKLETALAGETYMAGLRDSGVLGANQTRATQRRELTGMHQVYASMMVLQCVQPLQQGVSSKNIASVLGMGASMWLLSPNFRVQVGAFAGQMRDVITERIAGREDKKNAKAQGKFDKLESKGRGDQLGQRWKKRMDRVQFAERGHRLPFTNESAAMTEVALAEAAYADMRRPGVDPAQVQDRYTSALTALYEYVDADGLNREDVSRSMRVIVGKRVSKDPSVANVFVELGHGRFTRGEPREVYIEGGTETVTAWTGDFVDSYDGRVIVSGSFRLRPPMGVNEHRLLSAETLAAEMTSASSVGELNDVLSHYVVASAVGRFPEVVEQVTDPAARLRLGKVRTMFESMAADGLSPDERHFAYTAAYIDAVSVVQRVNPELGNKWAEQYGQNWRERVAEEMRAYNDLGAQAGHTAAPSEPEKTHRFTATADGRVHEDREASAAYSSPTAEDIVDAEVVHEERRFAATADGRVHESYEPLETHSSAADEVIIDADVIEARSEFDAAHGDDLPGDSGQPGDDTDESGLDRAGSESEQAKARDSIVDGLSSTSTQAEYDQDVDLNSTSARVRRARVNQHYNEVDTGGITGIGRDEAAPLQDVDFQLG